MSNHRHLWSAKDSENPMYPVALQLSIGETKMASIGWLPSINVGGAFQPCLPRITSFKPRSLNPSANTQDRISSLPSNITTIWMPDSCNSVIAFWRSSKNAKRGHQSSSLALNYRFCCAYVDFAPPDFGMQGRLAEIIHSLISPHPLYRVHTHLPNPDGSFPYSRMQWTAWLRDRTIIPPYWCWSSFSLWML